MRSAIFPLTLALGLVCSSWAEYAIEEEPWPSSGASMASTEYTAYAQDIPWSAPEAPVWKLTHHEISKGESRDASLGELLSKLSVLASGMVSDTELLHPIHHYLQPFAEWYLNHDVDFKTVGDATRGFGNFAKASDRIETHDSEATGYTLGHNAYSHLSWEQFREHFSIGNGIRSSSNVLPAFDVEEERLEQIMQSRMLRGVSLPDEVDWVKDGAVTEVKNQGSCGSCWSFSTTGSMEGAHFIKFGELVELSEQILVDCDSYDLGCNGGLMDYSFHWIQQNGGICREADYPYTGTDGICHKSTCETVPGTGVASWVDVENSEEALMAAVAEQPVSIAIEADQMSFQLYSGGVLTATCGTNLDHGVLLVGYGVSEDGVKYWKVKNSWGPDWGMDGYILLAREAHQPGGECGILMQASYPVLASD